MTATFRVLYVFVVMEVKSRRLVHCNVTGHPTVAWTLQQFREVLPEVHPYRYILHDRECTYSRRFDDALEARLYVAPVAPGATRPVPDCAYLHTERRKPGVTLELLHLEYLEQHPTGYRYTRFCDLCRQWLTRHRLPVRQEHQAGELDVHQVLMSPLGKGVSPDQVRSASGAYPRECVRKS